MVSAPPPSISPALADLLEEVSKLVHKHHEDLNRCCEDWIQTNHAQPPHPPQKLDSDPPHPPAPAACFEHWINCPGMAAEAAVAATSASEPSAQALQSPKSLDPLRLLAGCQPLKDTTASEVALSKRRKRRASRAVHLVPSVGTVLDSTTRLQRLTNSRAYEMGSGILIFLNGIFIGWQVQFMAERAEMDVARGRPLQSGSPTGFFAMEVIFLLLFSIELGLRWVADGFCDFFRAHNAGWNALDTAVVAFSVADMFVEIFLESDSEFSGNISLLRVLRVVRVVRVAKVIRIMRFFRELRMMIFSILGSMKSLLWVLLVLAMTFYVFGITFTSGVSTALATADRWPDTDTEPLRMHFGTLDRSFLSLFMAMSGGNDWGLYYDALSTLPGQYRLLFLLFISFALFAVVNIVTGVFVQCAMESNSTDRDIMVHEELEGKKAYLKSMREVFEDMDEDDTGCISIEEFEKKLDDERVRAYFNALKLDVSDARTVFRLMDYDHSEEVNIDEFLTGCYRLQGESRSLDMKIMQCEVRYMQENFNALLEGVQDIKAALPLSRYRQVR